MPLTIRRRAGALLVPLAAAGLAVLPGAPAGAVDSAQPTPCAGMTLTDAAGDQRFSQSGLTSDPTRKKTPDNTDITGLFFNYKPGADGKPVLTANIQITKLDTTPPSPADAQGGTWYYVVYNYAGKAEFVRAALHQGGTIDYAYGNIDGNGVYTTDGTTKGKFFPGASGVVQIDVPAAAGGKPGAELGGAIATVDYIQGTDDAAGINNHVDLAPNQGNVQAPNGETYTVADCPAPTSTDNSGGTPPPPAPPAQSPPSQQTSSPPPSSGASSTLPFHASVTIGKASKARKGRTLRVKVQSDRAISNLKVQLKRSNGKGAALASGSLKQLNGLGTLKLKLRKSLKKGKYALIATGVVDGSTLRVGQQVLVK